MMKNKTWIAIGALTLPLLLRALWYYPGISMRPEIATPDYAALTIPQPPVETPAKDEEIRQLGGLVVVDYAHSNQFQPSEIQSLKAQVEKRGGRLEMLSDSTLLEARLKYASAYVVISPSIALTTTEIGLVEDFVGRGGRLVVFTDATRGMVYSDFFSGTTIVYPDANAVNPLLAPFGINVNNDYMYNLLENEGNFRNVFFDEFGKAELTFGLKQVALYGTHSVSSDSGAILLQGNGSTFSSVSDAHDPAQGGAAVSEDGNVVAFGDFTFLTPPYDNVADNSTLIANISDFVLAGELSPSLATFPYVFDQSVVQIYHTSDVQMTAEVISALGGLQSSLQATNVSMEVVDQNPANGDVLLLGLFAQNEDLDPLLNRFDIIVEDFSEYVTLPGFGNIGRAGNGILLFETGKDGNTLVLLADTVEDLTSLISTVSSGYLGSCVLQDKVGVCSVGFGGSFSEGGFFDEPVFPEDFFGDGLFGEFTPTPFVTLTP